MTLQLRRMARYGILGRYLPEFGQISGQMQHDLFHIYTVDAHTLQVIENMRKFRLPQAEEDFPVAIVILAWVHNKVIIEKLKNYISKGGKVISLFPLLEIYSSNGVETIDTN